MPTEEHVNVRSETRVTQTQHGKCEPMNPYEWPTGTLLRDLCKSVDCDHLKQFESCTTNANTDERAEQYIESNSTINESMNTVTKPNAIISNPKIWQASARLAFLKKFATEKRKNDKPLTKCIFEPDAECSIQQTWIEAVTGILGNNKKYTVDGIKRDDVIKCSNFHVEFPDFHEDFQDFITNECCKSNTRQLQWTVLSCPRGIQFQLHAHPNLELIYCIRGTLFEIRMNGKPPTRNFEDTLSDGSDRNIKVIGPTLTNLKRSWSFGALNAGQWLVNEVGSIHKSFTSSRVDGGCDLLVLWSGSHANIFDKPVSPDIDNAVNELDRIIQESSTCCLNSKNSTIPTTFLPDDER